MSKHYTSLNAENAIEQHLSGCTIGTLVSIRDAITMVRLSAPDSKLGDRELADRIASQAIARHCNISFDFEFEAEQRVEHSRSSAA